ncbi:sialate O-acetylesterase [Haloferula sp. A504]|uniref:sialate O-acetylesterase n=1 Tax=Haloferula sp. A504 TaxID=3373601 RepID=UPI0031C8A941|nr:sialate O-acetylesterase [Verrucomicrobiaceae bacterium E54]
MKHICKSAVLAASVLSLIGLPQAQAADKKLKVYILAGQSNMEGAGQLRVFDYMKEKPETRELYHEMKDSDGQYKIIDNTWISFLTGERGRLDGPNREVHGPLTAGYGSQCSRDYNKPVGDRIGPELAFGITVQKKYDQPILLIKTAWGGQSLHTNFRSPSSGPWSTDPDWETGARYRQMIEHVRNVLKDPKRVCPAYEGQGCELAGFVWFQGWNDLVDGKVYPDRDKEGGFDNYSKWLANFIRDVRKDLNAPGLPFVIGVIGNGGPEDLLEDRDKIVHLLFRKAMAAPAAMPEFKGNVFAVETAPFWDRRLGAIDKKKGEAGNKEYVLKIKHHDHENADGKMSDEDIAKFMKAYREKLFTKEDLELDQRAIADSSLHYLGSPAIYSLIGQAFAEALIDNDK